MRFSTRLNIGYSLAVILTCSWSLPANAQDSPGAAAFQRLDKNQNGKITRDEAPTADSFAAVDSDKDGAVTPEEFRNVLGGQCPENPPRQSYDNSGP